MRRAFLVIFLILLILLVLVSATADAKTVFVAWRAIRGAAKYEIEFHSGEKVLLDQTLSAMTVEDKFTWKGDLQPGAYQYRLRAVDRVGRLGQWSKLKSLIVLPVAPSVTSPRDGQWVTLYSPEAPLRLKWNASFSGLYWVEAKLGGKIVFQKTMSENRLYLPGAKDGRYEWRVASVVVDPVTGRNWRSRPSEAATVIVRHGRMGAPRPIYPVGKIPPSDDGKLKFKWSEVSGAQAYLVRIRALHARSRSPASDAFNGKSFVVKDHSITAAVPDIGDYSWTVSALSSSEVDEYTASESPHSVAEFTLDKNARYSDGDGYVALSTLIAPYNYEVVDQTAGTQGTTASLATSLRLSGEYWFAEQWGVGVALQNNSVTVSNSSFDLPRVELMGKYRLRLDSNQHGWSIAPRFGAQGREFVDMMPTFLFNQRPNQFMAWGPDAGLDVRDQISDRLSLGVKADYFLPLMLGSGMGWTGTASDRDFSVGAQAYYWLSRHWGVGLGGYFEMNSVSYTYTPQSVGTAHADQVYMDGTYFFGTLMYSFGH